MGKNAEATCSKSMNGVRFYQVFYLVLDLGQLTNTKLKVFLAMLLTVKDTHKESISSNKTRTLTKRINTDIIGSYTQIKFSNK